MEAREDARSGGDTVEHARRHVREAGDVPEQGKRGGRDPLLGLGVSDEAGDVQADGGGRWQDRREAE